MGRVAPTSTDKADEQDIHDASAANLSRRRFLQTMGLSVLALAGSSSIVQLVRFAAEAVGTPPKPPGTKHRWMMVIDLRRCDGCEKCTKACQEMHYLPKETEFIKIYELPSASGGTYYFPRLCMQCTNAPCLQVCPVGATFSSSDGVVLVDQDRCIGCRLCMAACPYNARYFNWSSPPVVSPERMEAHTSPEYPVPQQKGTVGKCVLCVHRLRKNQLPYCVEACTMEALYIGDWETDLATNGRETVQLSAFLRENDAFRFKDELNTGPQVYYIAGHGQDVESKYYL